MVKVLAIPLPYLGILLIMSLEGRNTQTLYIRKYYSPLLFPTYAINIINTRTQEKITHLYLILGLYYLRPWKEGIRTPSI